VTSQATARPRGEVVEVAQRRFGGERGEGRRRVPAAAPGDFLEVAAGERIGERRPPAGERRAAQHAVFGEERGESRPRQRRHVAAEDFGRVGAGEERRLPGRALRQAGDAERGVERREAPTVSAPDALRDQRSAEQGAQRRHRLDGERIAVGYRRQADAVDEEEEKSRHARYNLTPR
jgi:hypothetical protein